MAASLLWVNGIRTSTSGSINFVKQSYRKCLLMINIERVYRYSELFQSRHHLSASQFQKILEISPATFKRDLSILRDRFEFPIVYDRDILAYRLDRTTFKKQLPGVWFSSEEIALIRVLSNRLNLDN